MFERPEPSYNIKPEILGNILEDEANPLKQIVSLIADDSKVLDIGAGNGILAMLFQKSNKNIHIDGVEPNTYAAVIAKKNYKKFYNGYLTTFKKELKSNQYDYIVLADVIEHVVDPISFIEEVKAIMSETTKLIFSIPNVAFASVRLNLLFGHFDYTNSGILEKTHLRFYTHKTIIKLLFMSDLNIEKEYHLHRNILFTESIRNINKISLPLLCQLNSDKYAKTYQFLFVTTLVEVSEKNTITLGFNNSSCVSIWLKLKLSFFKKFIKKFIGKNK